MRSPWCVSAPASSMPVIRVRLERHLDRCWHSHPVQPQMLPPTERCECMRRLAVETVEGKMRGGTRGMPAGCGSACGARIGRTCKELEHKQNANKGGDGTSSLFRPFQKSRIAQVSSPVPWLIPGARLCSRAPASSRLPKRVAQWLGLGGDGRHAGGGLRRNCRPGRDGIGAGSPRHCHEIVLRIVAFADSHRCLRGGGRARCRGGFVHESSSLGKPAVRLDRGRLPCSRHFVTGCCNIRSTHKSIGKTCSRTDSDLRHFAQKHASAIHWLT